MKSVLLLVSLVAVTAVSLGQEAWIVPFAAAYEPNLAGFNSGFAANGLPQAASRHYGWGLELRSLVGPLLVGPLFYRTWDDAENDSFQLRTEAWGIFATAGPKLIPLPFFSIVPMLGLGGLSQSFNIRTDKGDIRFDSLLARPGQSATMLSGMKPTGLAALELGLSAITDGARYGVTLRGGYVYSPFAVTWHQPGGARITNTPAGRFGGPFYSIGVLIAPTAQVTGTR